MFDASTKIPEGILYGSSHNLGNFDECINVAVNVPGEINSEPDVLKGQYCLAKVYLSGIENQNEKEESYSPHSAWGTLKVITLGQLGLGRTTFLFTTCYFKTELIQVVRRCRVSPILSNIGKR